MKPITIFPMNKHKSLLLRVALVCLFTLSVTQFVSGQSVPTWQWAKQTGGVGDDLAASTTTDASGNAYQIGSFAGTIQCGTTTLSGTAPTNLYLEKFDSQGNVIWAVQSRAMATARAIGDATGTFVVLDAAGNIYVSGNYHGAVSFGTITLNSQGSGVNGFVVKYSPQGVPLWASSATGSGNTRAYSIALTPSGELYWAGYYEASAAFGSNTLLSKGDSDVFLAKLDNNGNVLWAQSAGGTLQDYGSSVAVDAAGGVYLDGGFQGTAVFGNLSVSSNGQSDGFVAHYSAQGQVLFITGFGGPLSDTVANLRTNAVDEVYVVGGFQGTATFGNLTLNSAGGTDGYVLKCTAQGLPLWANRFGDSGPDICSFMAVHPSGTVYISGTFNGTVPFGTQTLTSSGGTDIFLMRINATGTVSWAVRAGGLNNDYTGGLQYGANGRIYLGGRFTGSSAFGATVLNSLGLQDAFIGALQDNLSLAARASTQQLTAQLSPNPSTSGQVLRLQLPAEWRSITQMSIYDASGRVVTRRAIKVTEMANSEHAVEVSTELPSGAYLIKCENSGAALTIKLVVQ